LPDRTTAADRDRREPHVEKRPFTHLQRLWLSLRAVEGFDISSPSDSRLLSPRLARLQADKATLMPGNFRRRGCSGYRSALPDGHSASIAFVRPSPELRLQACSTLSSVAPAVVRAPFSRVSAVTVWSASRRKPG
jgi:hypothetical protein